MYHPVIVNGRIHSLFISTITSYIPDYNCQRQNSSLAVYGHSDSSSVAASAVGIVLLFLTVAYMW